MSNIRHYSYLCTVFMKAAPEFKVILTLIAKGPTRQTRQHSSQTQKFLDHSLAGQLLVREEAR